MWLHTSISCLYYQNYLAEALLDQTQKGPLLETASFQIQARGICCSSNMVHTEMQYIEHSWIFFQGRPECEHWEGNGDAYVAERKMGLK